MTTAIIVLRFLGGFTLLILGAEVLLRGASRLAIAVGISPLVVGLTVVAYGTSAPEMAVTIGSMYAQPPQPELAIGNVVGSNISNILLVLGIVTVVVPLTVSRSLAKTTVPVMILVTGVVWLMSLDGEITRLEGIALLGGAVFFSVFSIARSRRETAAALAAKEGSTRRPARGQFVRRFGLNLTYIVIGLVILVFGARLLVDGATQVAQLLGVRPLIIGLTIVAVGTSLPEIATSLIASLRGHRDMAVGNVVGSNIFNLLLVLGLCAAVAPRPVTIPTAALRFDIPIMFAVAASCWPIFYTEWTITRGEGLAFLAFYVAYVVFLFLQNAAHTQLEQYQTVMVYFVLPLTVLVLFILSTRHWRRDSKNPQ